MKTLFGAMLGIIIVGLLAIPAPVHAQATLGACVNNVNGNMRLASGPSVCRNPEVFVQWNVQGIKGDKGDQGIQGGKGDPGVNAEPKTYAVGETGPAGGIVFYVTDGGIHGLEAAPEDQYDQANPGQGGNAGWGCLYEPTFATATAVGAGARNTANMLVYCNQPRTAARIAYGYASNNQYGWFLPSKGELTLLWQHKAVVGGFTRNAYWSSTERDNVYAWYQNFDNGTQDTFGKDGFLGVRAIRAF